MELKLTNDELLELHQGCRELLAVDDLETLFSFRVSSILEVLTPKVKAYNTTRGKLDRRYATIDIVEDGEVVGKRPKEDEREEYNTKTRTLLDAGVEVKVPSIRMSAIYQMREDEGLEIPASTIHNVHRIIQHDMELDDDDAPEKVEATAEPEKPKKRTRAERVKAENGVADAAAAPAPS